MLARGTHASETDKGCQAGMETVVLSIIYHLGKSACLPAMR